MGGITINIKDLDKAFASIDKYSKQVEQEVNLELKAFGDNTATMAIEKAPVDESALKLSIKSNPEHLKVSVTVNVDYAAYVEFGTKSFAAEYVGSLPATWQEFAAQFKGGGGGGNFMSFFYKIFEWVQRKGFAAAYSIKSQKRSNAKVSIANEREAAYLIALSIVKKGIKPHPYLIPAFEANKKLLIDHLKAVLNAK